MRASAEMKSPVAWARRRPSHLRGSALPARAASLLPRLRLLASELAEGALRLCSLALQPGALGGQIPGALAVALDVAGEGILGAGQLVQALEGVQLPPQDGVALLERPGPLDVGGHALAEPLQLRQARRSRPALHQAVRLDGVRRLLGALVLLLAGLEDVAAPVHDSSAGERAAGSQRPLVETAAR